jgi:hypothetical protein
MKAKNSKLTESDQFLRQALVGLLGLMLKSGASINIVRALTLECLQRATDEEGSHGKQRGLDIHRLASILRTWHKETRFLSKDGTPSPLLLGGRIGLRTLVNDFYPPAKVALVIATLKRARLIKRHGANHWLPTEGHVRLSTECQETLDHVSEGVSRFIETVVNNVNSRSKADLLFEQSCKVRELPATNCPAFRQFVRQQGIVFLTAVDDWLESRAVGPTRNGKSVQTYTAGAFTFAYIDRIASKRVGKKPGR